MTSQTFNERASDLVFTGQKSAESRKSHGAVQASPAAFVDTTLGESESKSETKLQDSHIFAVPSERHTDSPFINPYSIHTLEQLIELYNLTIPNRQRDTWRWTYPNVGYLRGFEHFGRVFIHATNGILAYYRVDESGGLWLGHLGCFVGPLAKEYVYEEDWDWDRNKRKVSVFRRADGSIVVIPQDSFWDRYWSKHGRMSKEEHQVLAEVGHSITISEVDTHLARLKTKSFTGERRVGTKEKTKRQKLLETL